MMMFVKKWRDHLGNAVTERSLALQTGYHPRHSSSCRTPWRPFGRVLL